MRSRYGTYPEYHTSLDNLDLVTPSGLQGSFAALATAIGALECNENWRLTCVGEPQLGKRGLYPDLSGKNHVGGASILINDIVAYADGENDFLALCGAVRGDPATVAQVLASLLDHGLLERVEG
jgi:aminopeptidase-like protein